MITDDARIVALQADKWEFRESSTGANVAVGELSRLREQRGSR